MYKLKQFDDGSVPIKRKKKKKKKTIAYDFEACVALHVMGRLHRSTKQKL